MWKLWIALWGLVSTVTAYGHEDMIADKTDNVEVVVALDGTPMAADEDIGNEIMYTEESRGVPLYVNNYGKADHGGPFDGHQNKRQQYEPSFGYRSGNSPHINRGHNPLYSFDNPLYSNVVEEGKRLRQHGGFKALAAPGSYRPEAHEGPYSKESQGDYGDEEVDTRDYAGAYQGDPYGDPHSAHQQYSKEQQGDSYSDHEDQSDQEEQFGEDYGDHQERFGGEPGQFGGGRRQESVHEDENGEEYVEVGYYGAGELEGGHAAYEELFQEGEQERAGHEEFGASFLAPGQDFGGSYDTSYDANQDFGAQSPDFDTPYESGSSAGQNFGAPFGGVSNNGGFQEDHLFDGDRRAGAEDHITFSEPGKPQLDGFGNEIHLNEGQPRDGFYEGFGSEDTSLSRGGGQGATGALFGSDDLFQPPSPPNPDYDDFDGREREDAFKDGGHGGHGGPGGPGGPPRGHPHHRQGPPRSHYPRGPQRPNSGFNFNIFGGRKNPPIIKFGF